MVPAADSPRIPTPTGNFTPLRYFEDSGPTEVPPGCAEKYLRVARLVTSPLPTGEARFYRVMPPIKMPDPCMPSTSFLVLGRIQTATGEQLHFLEMNINPNGKQAWLPSTDGLKRCFENPYCHKAYQKLVAEYPPHK